MRSDLLQVCIHGFVQVLRKLVEVILPPVGVLLRLVDVSILVPQSLLLVMGMPLAKIILRRLLI